MTLPRFAGSCTVPDGTFGAAPRKSGAVHLVAVASDYAWDVVETVRRLGREVSCHDNVGGADPRLPGLDDGMPGGPVDWALGLSSGEHRVRAATALAPAGLGEPIPLVDPTAIVASTAVVAHGAYVNAGVVIASNTRIGCYANVNRSASVGHDCELGFGSSLGPAVTLTGHVVIGAGAFVGAGAVVLPGVRIGVGSMVGAGAVVTRDVADGHVVVGNPARTLRVLELQETTPECPHCSLR